MATGRWFVCAAVALLSVIAITFSTRAEDLNVPNLDNKSIAINPNDAHQTDAAVAAQSRGDDASRINDLESTRAALDRRAGPALSLSISGWVGEQVIYHH
jgi:hypothetical protein